MMAHLSFSNCKDNAVVKTPGGKGRSGMYYVDLWHFSCNLILSTPNLLTNDRYFRNSIERSEKEKRKKRERREEKGP
jgi:hypothetical protein